MNIWNGIKKFFSLSDETQSLTRKMKHGQRPATPLTPEERDKKDLYREQYEKDVSALHDSLTLISEDQEQNCISFIKSKQISSTPLTENEIRYIALNCDFTLNDEMDPDPRLVAAINFAINLHTLKVKEMISEKVEDIVSMVDRHKEKSNVK